MSWRTVVWDCYSSRSWRPGGRRATAIGKEVVVLLLLDAGGLPQEDALPHPPTVRPPFAAELHQLDGSHAEFDGRKNAES